MALIYKYITCFYAFFSDNRATGRERYGLPVRKIVFQIAGEGHKSLPKDGKGKPVPG